MSLFAFLKYATKYQHTGDTYLSFKNVKANISKKICLWSIIGMAQYEIS